MLSSCAVLVTSEAFAQPAPHTEVAAGNPSEKAEEYFHRAVEDGKSGDWAAALEGFEASFRMHPTSAAAMNAANSLRHLGRLAAALDAYEAVLARFGTEMPELARKRVESEIASLHPLVGELSLEHVPSGAALSVDGRPTRLPEGAKPIYVEPGWHIIAIAAPDYQPFEERHRFVAGTRVTVTVPPKVLAPSKEGSAAPSPRPPSTSDTTRLRERAAPPLFVEIFGGPSFASSFGGDAAASCSKTVVFADGSAGDGCSHRRRPLGGDLELRVGYRFTEHVGVHASLGYSSLSERMRRSLQLQGDHERDPTFASRSAVDELTLSGVPFAVGASYRLSPRVPLSFGLSAGLLIAWQRGRVSGSFAEVGAGAGETVWQLELSENTAYYVIPFLAPEVVLAVKVYRSLSVGAGLKLRALFAPSRVRRGDAWQLDGGRRAALSSEGHNSVTAPLPDEVALSTLLTVTPSVVARWDF